MTRDALLVAGSLLGTALVVLGAVAFLPPGPTVQAQGSPTILWQDPTSIVDCGHAYSGQAVTLADYPGGTGCPETWFVFVPAQEGGNESEELSFVGTHRFTGVLMDDFAPPSYPTYERLKNVTTTCAVLYADAEQPPITVGGCVVLAVYPTGSTTQLSIRQAERAIRSDRLYLLAYGAPFSAWPGPIPASYLSAMEQEANKTNGGLILWH